jgi:hypothetical protein
MIALLFQAGSRRRNEEEEEEGIKLYPKPSRPFLTPLYPNPDYHYSNTKNNP